MPSSLCRSHPHVRTCTFRTSPAWLFSGSFPPCTALTPCFPHFTMYTLQISTVKIKVFLISLFLFPPPFPLFLPSLPLSLLLSLPLSVPLAPCLLSVPCLPSCLSYMAACASFYLILTLSVPSRLLRSCLQDHLVRISLCVLLFCLRMGSEKWCDSMVKG